MRDLMEIRPEHCVMARLEYHWQEGERFLSDALVPVVVWERPAQGLIGEQTFLAPDTEHMADGYLRQRALVSTVSMMSGVCWCCGAVAPATRGTLMREVPLGELSPN
jgi:hypothetical protein